MHLNWDFSTEASRSAQTNIVPEWSSGPFQVHDLVLFPGFLSFFSKWLFRKAHWELILMSPKLLNFANALFAPCVLFCGHTRLKTSVTLWSLCRCRGRSRTASSAGDVPSRQCSGWCPQHLHSHALRRPLPALLGRSRQYCLWSDAFAIGYAHPLYLLCIFHKIERCAHCEGRSGTFGFSFARSDSCFPVQRLLWKKRNVGILDVSRAVSNTHTRARAFCVATSHCPTLQKILP